MNERPSGAAPGLHWRVRSALSGAARRRIRAITDPLVGPLGSIRGAHTREPLVTLTFDDGPDRASTPGVLDALAGHGARAAFFVLADRAEAHPDLIRRMVADGHDVCLHGADHRRLTRLAPAELKPHIADGARRLAALTGQGPRWFRPPYGSQSLRSYVAARRCGMDVVVWSADCSDWEQRPEQEIADQATAAARPGAIVLLHDALAADPEVPAPDPRLDRPGIVHLVLSGLKERGLRAVSLEVLLASGRAHRTAWFRP
jgi:peptidoglycan/xylan/chitin deacetylase (PgdA/CDA1 family)